MTTLAPARRVLLSWGLVLAGTIVGGLLLLCSYGLDLTGFPATVWRDHPFDFVNLEFTRHTLSLGTRLWAHDPLHLFGWTPNVFYNPLASLVAGLFVGLGGGGEAAYRVWLILVALLSALAFLPLMPRRLPPLARAAGGLVAAWLSLLVYPMDVGLLDANPVQVLYTGQWSQRIGIALGLVAISCFWHALRAVGDDWRKSIRPGLAGATLLGASLWCHFMSGYACAAVMGLLSVCWVVAARSAGRGWQPAGLLLLPAMLPVMGLLYADFFFVFFNLQASHHALPLLKWHVPLGAMATVREVMLPALPLLLVPLACTVLARRRSRPDLSRALFPLVIFACVQMANVDSALFLLLLVLAATWLAAWLEGGLHARHWLAAAAYLLLVLACGPDSLRPGGLDLSLLVPFHGSVGWAKLAAFSRWLLLAWFGLVVAENLAPARGWTRLVLLVLACMGLVVPFALSQGTHGRTGAQMFFGWMNRTDREATEAVRERMNEVAARTPPDGYLLVEDTLHHPEGSALADRGLPNGHLPYSTGPQAGRPVLGGAVTTRYVTHPLAHTSRGQLLCRDFSRLAGDPLRTGALVVDRLRQLGISDLLVHSPDLIRALARHPAALRVDTGAGLTHFMLEHHHPILTDSSGLFLEGASLRFERDAVIVRLPAGTSGARLRQVHHDLLDCTCRNTNATSCNLAPRRETTETFEDCLVDETGTIQVAVPWIRIELDPPVDHDVELRIESRPPLLPFAIMILAWIGAVVVLFASRRKAS